MKIEFVHFLTGAPKLADQPIPVHLSILIRIHVRDLLLIRPARVCGCRKALSPSGTNTFLYQ